MRTAIRTAIAVMALGHGVSSTVAAQEPHGDDDHRDESENVEVVSLTAGEIDEFGIEMATAGPGEIVSSVAVPAEVRPNADRFAHIVPRYSGIVTEVKVNIGEHVRQGQVLATVESDDSLAPFDVVTLISGTVIAKHITLGEAVGRGNPAFEIADLSSVWIDITIYQRDLGRVRVGQSVELYVGHELIETGTVSYVTPVVDEKTRTATARAVLPNRDGVWRPGMFVTAKIITSKETVPIAVAQTAVHALDDGQVVFVETAEGFVPRPVRVGRMDASRIEIIDGLAAGDRYVERGGFTLKAELGKGSFGESHAH